MVNAVAINVMVQCSETELDHYINANGIILKTVLDCFSLTLVPLSNFQYKCSNLFT